jgi:hypothetical protein
MARISYLRPLNACDVLCFVKASHTIIQGVRKWVIGFSYFSTKRSCKVLFRNTPTNHVRDKLEKFKFGPGLEPALHSYIHQ